MSVDGAGAEHCARRPAALLVAGVAVGQPAPQNTHQLVAQRHQGIGEGAAQGGELAQQLATHSRPQLVGGQASVLLPDVRARLRARTCVCGCVAVVVCAWAGGRGRLLD